MNQFFNTYDSHLNIFGISLFVLSLVFLALLVIRFKTVKPSESGECLHCGYPLKGLSAETQNCPECGKFLTPNDWSTHMRWRAQGCFGFLLHPIILWACFSFCFVCSMFFAVRIDKTQFTIRDNSSLNISNKKIEFQWLYNLYGNDLTIAGKSLISRHVLDEHWNTNLRVSHKGSRTFEVKPRDLTFVFLAGVRVRPHEFENAPGMTTVEADWHSNGYWEHKRHVTFPVNHETVGRVLKTWDIEPEPKDVDAIWLAIATAADNANKHRPQKVVWNLKPASSPQSFKTIRKTHPPRVWLHVRSMPLFFGLFIAAASLVYVIRKMGRVSTENTSTTKPELPTQNK